MGKRVERRAFPANAATIPCALVLCTLLLMTPTAPTAYAASITSDGTLGTTVHIAGKDYTIQDGTRAGSNLFHSFHRFHILEGETARFSGPLDVENIIGRVTGGERSLIDGLLGTDIPGAALYLLNPSGVLFGPHASLDVQGAFHVSTADYIRFEDGSVFYADPARSSLLSISPPVAFGFLNPSPGSISVEENSELIVPEGETLSLIAGDMDFNGVRSDDDVGAPGGRINLASVASPGEVVPLSADAAGRPDLVVDSFDRLGTIRMESDASIDAGGAGGGVVVIRGGRLHVRSSFISASAKANGGGLTRGIDIKVREDIVLEGSSQINSNVFPGVASDSGDIRICADSLDVDSFSQINSVAYGAGAGLPASSGESGDIHIQTRALRVAEGGMVRAGTGGSGDSGDLRIRTDRLDVRDAGILFTPAFGGTGRAGDIDVKSKNVVLSNDQHPGYVTGMVSMTYSPGTGDTGDIRLRTGNLEMSSGTEISTSTRFAGQSGNIDITVEGPASIQGTRSLDPSGHFVNTGIFANTFGSGSGGDISLTAESLGMSTKASIEAISGWWGTGDAGNIALRVGQLDLKYSAIINSSTLYGWGSDSGQVDITANTINIRGAETSNAPFSTDTTGISTAAGEWAGKGGDITIRAENLSMENRGSINASSLGAHRGGDILMTVDNGSILGGSNVISSALGTGDGGDVRVQATHFKISGVHPEAYVDITGQETLAPSGIGSQAGTGTGNAGEVFLAADNVEILDGGRLTAETFGHGEGGNVVVQAGELLVSGVNAALDSYGKAHGFDPEAGRSMIATASNSGGDLGEGLSGTPGNIVVRAGRVKVTDGGLLSSETETLGGGGDIRVEADQVIADKGGSISAKSRGSRAGKGGNIAITARRGFLGENALVTTEAENAEGGSLSIAGGDVDFLNGMTVSAESSGEGDAGDISITADHTFTMRESTVSTEAREADGGNIAITAGYMLHMVDSAITSSVGGGPQTTGGNISIDPVYVILQRSRIIANAYEGKGGNITIVADCFMADPDSIVEASSALGIDGTVDIQAPIQNVSGSISSLPKDFKSAARLLRQACAARVQGGQYSSFVLSGREGLPIEPGGLMPSPVF